jgi:protein-S-isoprenylcysteine O-methyltransferase Ste14
VLRLTIVFLATLNFVMFGIALRVVFSSNGRAAPPTTLLVSVGTMFSCLHVYLLATAPLEPNHIAVGAVMYLLACALFSWTAHSVRGREFTLAYAPGTPPAVFSGGPYRWVRHPFYLSYSLAWSAGVVTVSDWRLLMTLAIMLGFYVAAAYREEQQMLRGPAADQYRAYRRQVGLLPPGL